MRRLALLVVVVAAVGFAGGATAAWALTASGPGAAKAKTLGPGNTPAASVSGHKVTVTWAASTYMGGGAVAGYLVRRYNATTGVAQTVGNACSGTISSLSCTENGVQSGSWQYAVTPAAGTNWRGSESAKSTAVGV